MIRSTFQLQALILALSAMLGVFAEASAQNVPRVTARVERQQAFVGETVIFEITVSGPQPQGTPTVTTDEGLEVRYLGPHESRSVQIVNGRRFEQSTTSFRYQITADSPGTYTIRGNDLQVRGRNYSTNDVQISFIPPQPSRDVQLELEAEDRPYYVGEPIDVTVRWTIAYTPVVDVRFSFDGLGGDFEVLAIEPRSPRQNQGIPVLDTMVMPRVTAVRQDNRNLTQVEFTLTVVPRRAGALTLGPATVATELQLREQRGFFDNAPTKRYVVPGEPLTFRIEELPVADRPAGFNGLLWKCALTAAASPKEVGVGDPMTLAVQITGRYVESIELPDPTEDSEFSERFKITQQRSPEVIDNTKMYLYTLRATSEDVREIPPIKLPWFDTSSGQYRIAQTEAIPIEVRPTKVITASDAVGQFTGSLGSAVESSERGIAHNYIGTDALVDQGFSLYSSLMSPVSIALLGGPPMVCGLVSLVGLVRRRDERNAAARRRRQAYVRAKRGLDHAADAGAVAAALYGFIGDWFDRPASGLTPRESAHIVQSVIDVSGGEALESLLHECDRARFGGATAEIERLREQARSLLSDMHTNLRRTS